MRLFNTEGPVRPNDHYAIPPLERMDGDERPAPTRLGPSATSCCTGPERLGRDPQTGRR